jgi:Zn-dependent oligopeptidase
VQQIHAAEEVKCTYSVGLLATVSLFVFPSTNIITNAQSDNKTQGLKEDAQEKLFTLTQKFNEFLNNSGVNLTLPRDGDLSSKLQELKNSDARSNHCLKSLYKRFRSSGANMTNVGNETTTIGELQQEAGSNFTQLIQKFQDLGNNQSIMP